MTYNETLAKKIRESIKGKRNITEKKMFGGLAFLLKGKMFCGIVKDDLMIRTGPEMYEKASSQPYVRPMDFTGKPMKGFVYVASQGCKTAKSLSNWINLGLDYVSKLKK
ncbi:MAG: TfoX/Sxy family protein [Nitrosopumilaceae archaeon]